MVDRWSDLECEWYAAGELVRAPVTRIDETGFFVATAAALAEGEEVELRLVGGELRSPVYMRGVVVSRVVREALASDGRPGLRFRLLRFSSDYARLLVGTTGNAAADASAAGDAAASVRRERLAKEERDWMSGILGSDESGGASEKRSPAERWVAWDDYEPLPDRAGTPLWDDESLVPDAIVLDDGELDDVVEVLGQLGIKAERQSPESDDFFTRWTRPRHLLVASARRALQHRLPLNPEAHDFVAIAVADSDAKTVSNAVCRRGYRYVISRPVHPLAMAMLFRQAVFRDADQRTIPREVVGCPVRWWSGWARKRTGLVFDVSSAGCQLRIDGSAARGDRIKLAFSDAVTEGRGFRVAGEVVRARPEANGMMLGVAFRDPSAKASEGLQRLLVRSGPSRLMGGPMPRVSLETLPAARGEASGPLRERRRKRRAVVQREVVALEHATSLVRHTLVSRDLSVDGMRVEPHPGLSLDDRMDIALYEDGDAAPLVVAAVVARDDGRGGWWLRFVGVEGEVRRRLERALDRFPPVARLGEASPQRVVLGHTVEKASADDDDATGSREPQHSR